MVGGARSGVPRPDGAGGGLRRPQAHVRAGTQDRQVIETPAELERSMLVVPSDTVFR